MSRQDQAVIIEDAALREHVCHAIPMLIELGQISLRALRGELEGRIGASLISWRSHLKALALQVATAFLEGVKLEQLPADRLAAIRDPFVGVWQCFSDVSGVGTSKFPCNSRGHFLFTTVHDSVRTSGNALDGLQGSHGFADGVQARLHDGMQNFVKTVTDMTATVEVEDVWCVQGKGTSNGGQVDVTIFPKSFAEASRQGSDVVMTKKFHCQTKVCIPGAVTSMRACTKKKGTKKPVSAKFTAKDPRVLIDRGKCSISQFGQGPENVLCKCQNDEI